MAQRRFEPDGRYKRWRRAVLKRDGNECIACGNTERLHAHHVKGWTRFPEHRYDLDNGRTLCWLCHRAVHWWMGNYRAPIQSEETRTKKRLAACAYWERWRSGLEKPRAKVPAHLVPRGDRSGARKHPEAIPRGDRSGARTHPESRPRGDQHWTRRLPWLIKATVARGDQHGSHTKPERRTYGERNGCAKLTDEVVLELRQRYPQESFRTLAAAFGLPCGLVCRVIRGERWPHLPGARPWDRTYYNSALTADQVRDVMQRHAAGERQKEIARSLSVSIALISNILCGKTWCHITGLQCMPRGHRGERNAAAKLTAEDVRRIRALAAQGHSQRDIGALMGVTQSNIGHILRGKSWTHVT